MKKENNDYRMVVKCVSNLRMLCLIRYFFVDINYLFESIIEKKYIYIDDYERFNCF